MRIRNVAFPSRIKGRVKNSHLLDHDYLAQAPDTEAERTYTEATMAEHGYYNPKSPDSRITGLEEKIESLKKVNKIEKQRVHRLKKKVASLKSLIGNLKSKDLISSNCEDYLNMKFSGVSVDILKRAMNPTKHGKKGACTPELRAFAMTLQFYSKKAYNYVRDTFNLALPHERVIQDWYSKVGFNISMLNYIGKQDQRSIDGL